MLPFIVRAYLVCVAHQNENMNIEIKSRGAGLRTRELPTCPSAASVYTAVYMCRVLFLGRGWDLALYCTFVPRVCRVIPCPILLVRTWYRTVFSCDNNSVFNTLHSKQHRFFWWDVSKKAISPASVYTAV